MSCHVSSDVSGIRSTLAGTLASAQLTKASSVGSRPECDDPCEASWSDLQWPFGFRNTNRELGCLSAILASSAAPRPPTFTYASNERCESPRRRDVFSSGGSAVKSQQH